MQLNRMIAEALADPDFYIPATQNGNSLTIAGVDDVPVEITMGTCIERTDLTSSHEEADPIIVQHAISRCMQGENVRVISDDTDVFLLLLHFYVTHKCTSALYMSSPVANRPIVDLRATAQKNKFTTKSTAAVAEWLGRRTPWSCWLYGEREVVSSIPGRGNIVGWVFPPTRWLERFSLIWICLSFQILNLFRTLSSWGSINYKPSALLL